MNDSFQYGDIIFLGLAAAFILFRLRAMLGRDIGIDPREVWKNASRNTPPSQSAPLPERTLKKPAEDELVPASLRTNTAVSDGLKAIKAGDMSFSTSDFLSGARVAFEWVVEAFSKGDKDKLRSILSDDRFRHFADEIDARGASGTKCETTLISILATDITEASMKDKLAHITVQFTSEQMNVMRDTENKVVGGDPSEIEKVVDIWTFERDTTSRDPNWKIVAT